MTTKPFAAPLLLVGLTMAGVRAPSVPPASQGPTPLVHYPLVNDLNDVTGRHPPLPARNAPLHAGQGIFCNGLYELDNPDACSIHTPALNDLDLSAFTISVEFLSIRGGGSPWRPVFVAGRSWRWLSYALRPGGGVEMGYSNHQPVVCSVKYRPGFWHEATITFDGRAATLYLDGVAGCRENASLQTGNEKTIGLTNFGNASTFYGMVRNLKVFNGVVVPATRVPVADTFPVPPPSNLSPADLLLAECPTAPQVASVDTDLRITFESDPTSGEPLACTAAAGSRNLSPTQKRVYNSLLLMRRIQFAQPLPWTKEPLYKWLVGSIRGIRFRSDITNSFCCDPARVINLESKSESVIALTDRWVEPSMHGGLSSFLLLVVHEARHAEGRPHTCGTKDRTVEEMGGWGAAYYLARWLAEQTDQAFFTSGGVRYNEQLSKSADMLRRTSFCQP